MTANHPFHDYVAGQIEKMLRERRVVVFYDPREEFGPFVDELTFRGESSDGLSRARVGTADAVVVRYEGSFFELRLAIEPNAALDAPEHMLLYVPGVGRDRQGSVLMELEKAGVCYEPQLRHLARNRLRKWFTDADIDQMLAPESLTYHDVVGFVLQGAGGGQASLLKLILGDGGSETLLERWLAGEHHDAEIEAKHAKGELFRLVAGRLGLEIPSDTLLDKARHQVARYVLVNELRADLASDAPSALALVSSSRTKDMQQRIEDVAGALRRSSPDDYVRIADAVEAELPIAELEVHPESLGSTDTFRFEERALLGHAGDLAAEAEYEQALQVTRARAGSFWVDRDLGRQAQWKACRLIAELGAEVTRTRKAVKKMSGTPGRWVEEYSAADGWHRVDRAQRELEGWIARMDEEPEPSLEKALHRVRREHEDLLKDMAQGYTKALVSGGWVIPDILHQTRVFSDVVETTGARAAHFLVDALRYEMGADLAGQLMDAEGMRITPAVAALPSITSVGMAALMPEAEKSFSVVDRKGALVVQIGDNFLGSSQERMKFLKALRPGAQDLDLGELLQKPTTALERKLGDARLVVVRSQSIDGLGELDSGLLARQVMDNLVGNVARAVRKLAKLGFEYFVISADHGYQFSLRKGEDMMIEKPGGDVLELHRRCWVGRGGQTPAACVRVSGAELGYQSDLDFVFPEGLSVFKAGGDLAYHHGGISLQEMVVPVISLRIPAVDHGAAEGPKVVLEQYPETLTNRTFGMTITVPGDLFTQDPVAVKLVLIAEGTEVGRVGLAVGADVDGAAGVVMVPPNQPISVGLMLASEEFQIVRIVAQDPATDAVLAQSPDIPVKLGI